MVQEAYKINYFTKENSHNESSLYLSLFISQNECQYAIFGAQQMRLLELADISLTDRFLNEAGQIDLLGLIFHNQFLDSKKFDKVNISFLNSRFTILPDAFADQSNIKNLLSFSSGLGDTFKTVQHKTPYCDFCFAMQPEWLDFFGKTFPNASVRHAGAVSIGLMFEQFSLSDKQLFLHVHAGHIEIVVKNQKDLQFYNVFSYESKEDILYYLLFSMEQWQLNPLTCKMAVAANLESIDELIKSIKKYVKYVDMCVFDKSVIAEKNIYQVAHHYYFTLLNQHLCAL